MTDLSRRRGSSAKPKNAPELRGAVFPTAFGWAAAAASPKGVRHLILHQAGRRRAESALRRLGVEAPPSIPPSLRPVVRAVQAYFEGKPVEPDFPLDLSDLTPFARRVTEATRKIGRGRVRSYGEVAAAAGACGAARAVGAVMARNPVPLAVP